MILDSVNPDQLVLQITAQYLDGSPKTELSEATVRVYYIEQDVEVNVLAATPLSHNVGSSVYRFIWHPSTLDAGTYVVEYTLTDLDGVTAVFPEDLIISERICPTAEEIDEKLSEEHGDGSWEGGTSGPCGTPELIPGD